MRWTCPTCNRALSVAYQICPFCQAPLASREGDSPNAAPRASTAAPDSAPQVEAPSGAVPPPPSSELRSRPANEQSLSGVEAISPAFARTKRELFQPFRFARWARFALVSLITGEFLGNGAGWTGPGNFNIPQRRGSGAGPDALFSSGWPASPNNPTIIFAVIGAIVGSLLALALLWVYAACVYRFILFDAVLHERCELKKGWRQWKAQGRRYFLWEISFGMATLGVLTVVVGVPVFLAWRAGIFQRAHEHVGLLIAGGVLLFFFVLFVFILSSLVSVFANDFLVPLMSLEKLTVVASWRRLWTMIRAEKKAYVGYLLMKIVLSVGSAMLFGIINLVLIMVPLVLAGVGVAIAAGFIPWNTFTISLAALLGAAALAGLLWLVCLVSAPAMVFFQSYAIHFFGSRYPALAGQLAAAPPARSTAISPAPEPSPAT